jgi:hypothetical protein
MSIHGNIRDGWINGRLDKWMITIVVTVVVVLVLVTHSDLPGYYSNLSEV